MNEEKIRDRQSYRKWETLLERLLKIGLEPEQAFETMKVVNAHIDNISGYHYAQNAMWATESLEQLEADRKA